MKSPRNKYLNDPHYKTLVDLMVSMIHKCQYTPSEMREAAILASIKYETMTIRTIKLPFSEELEKALYTVNKWTKETPNDSQ